MHSPMRISRLVPIAGILALASCSATGYSIAELAPEINATWDGAETRLGVGDLVRITFPFREAWNQEARVRADGTASFLLIDSVAVAGSTIAELDARLTALYEKATAAARIEKLDLTIDVPSGGGSGSGGGGEGGGNDGRAVFVVGEVERPGSVALHGRTTTLFEAISAAGGHKKATANLRNTILIRRIVATGEMRSWRLDAGIYDWGNQPAILLQPRDIVFVPNTAIDDVNIWVDKYIRQMLPFPYIVP
jgi:protein involved in polysaccharide export with SLBB domain